MSIQSTCKYIEEFKSQKKQAKCLRQELRKLDSAHQIELLSQLKQNGKCSHRIIQKARETPIENHHQKTNRILQEQEEIMFDGPIDITTVIQQTAYQPASKRVKSIRKIMDTLDAKTQRIAMKSIEKNMSTRMFAELRVGFKLKELTKTPQQDISPQKEEFVISPRKEEFTIDPITGEKRVLMTDEVPITVKQNEQVGEFTIDPITGEKRVLMVDTVPNN